MSFPKESSGDFNDQLVNFHNKLTITSLKSNCELFALTGTYQKREIEN
jgi:hypothetical protein